MNNLTYWRIEDGHFACFDIYYDGEYTTTYECDLYYCMNRPWVEHIAEKNWAFNEMLAELGQIEQAFAPYNYQNPA